MTKINDTSNILSNGTAKNLQGAPLSLDCGNPSVNDVLEWNGTNWIPSSTSSSTSVNVLYISTEPRASNVQIPANDTFQPLTLDGIPNPFVGIAANSLQFGSQVEIIVEGTFELGFNGSDTATIKMGIQVGSFTPFLSSPITYTEPPFSGDHYVKFKANYTLFYSSTNPSRMVINGSMQLLGNTSELEAYTYNLDFPPKLIPYEPTNDFPFVAGVQVSATELVFLQVSNYRVVQYNSTP